MISRIMMLLFVMPFASQIMAQKVVEGSSIVITQEFRNFNIYDYGSTPYRSEEGEDSLLLGVQDASEGYPEYLLLEKYSMLGVDRDTSISIRLRSKLRATMGGMTGILIKYALRGVPQAGDDEIMYIREEAQGVYGEMEAVSAEFLLLGDLLRYVNADVLWEFGKKKGKSDIPLINENYEDVVNEGGVLLLSKAVDLLRDNAAALEEYIAD